MSSVLDDSSSIPEQSEQPTSSQSGGEPPLPYEVTVRIEKPMLRRILHEVVNRYLGRKRYWLALIFGYAVATLLWRGDYSWYTWALIGLLIIAVIVPMFLHSMMLRRWLRQYQAEQGDEVCYRFDDEGIGAVTDAGEGRMAWQEFNRLLKLKEAWVLFARQDNAFTILPLRDLNSALCELITKKIEANEGEIV